MTDLAFFCAELAERAQNARNLEELRRSMLERLGEVVPFESKHWVNVPPMSAGDVRANAAPVHLVGAIAWPTLPQYHMDPVRYSTFRMLVAAQAVGGAVADGTILAPAELDRLPLYTEILRPAGVRTFAPCAVTFRGRLMSGIGLCRHGRGGRITEREVALLCPMIRALGVVEAAFLLEGAARGSERLDDLDANFGLSARERQVARLIAAGLSNKEIAAILGTSPHTVQKQSIRVYQKTRVSGRARFAAQFGSRPAGAARARNDV